jgi:N-methylhydantoinase A
MGIGQRVKPTISESNVSNQTKDLIKGEREVFWFELKGFVQTPIYDGTRLSGGDRIEGPAIIEMPHTAVLIHPGDRASVDGYGNIIVDLRRLD